jgi:hypothetical protein
MYKLEREKNVSEKCDTLDKLWRLLYDYEYNKPFVDTENGLLWRLVFIKDEENNDSNEFTYWMLFTIHHAIADVSFN